MKWEHTTITVSMDSYEATTEEAELTEEQQETIHLQRALKNLSDDEWELVSACQDTAYDQWRFFFKRPKITEDVQG
jgi:hypothetical protein